MWKKGLLKVVSPLPLTDEEKELCLRKAKAMMSAFEETEFIVDPSILGGLVFRSQSEVLDLSLKNKLELLKRVLIES